MGQKDPTRSLVPFTRVVVADPSPVITCGLRKVIEDDPRLKVAGEASTGDGGTA
jgi:DNA-binding NarL/FixJ family response regulator